MNTCKFENNVGKASGAIALYIGTDLNGVVPTHYGNTFTNNTGLNIESAGVYFLGGVGNKRLTFYGTTASGNQGAAAGFMYVSTLSTTGSHQLTFRDNPKSATPGTSPCIFTNNTARAPYAGPTGGAGVLFLEGTTIATFISWTNFTNNVGNNYGGAIGVQGGSVNTLSLGAGVNFSGNRFGPVGNATSPFTGKTAVCASSAAPPASSGPSSFNGATVPAALVSCFNVTACKDICTADYNADKANCDALCDQLEGRSSLGAKVNGPWVQNTTYPKILANPSGQFICNDACWSEA
jgi:hypothetical protein